MNMHAARLVGPIACLCVVLFACGDDPQDEPKDDAGIFGQNDSGNSSGNLPPADSGTQPTNPQCATGFKTTGFKPGSVVESRARPGGAEWTDLTNAYSKDGTFAKATLPDGTNETAQLVVSGFGFQIPANAETWGIEVEFTRHAPDAGIVEGKIEALVQNKVGRFKFIGKADGSGAPANWPSKNVGTHHFGQQIDTWGYDLYPADVNDPKFAIGVYAVRENGKTGTLNALVDGMTVAIHDCEK